MGWECIFHPQWEGTEMSLCAIAQHPPKQPDLDRYLQWPLFPSRSPSALSSTLSGNVRLPQLCYEERQETILSTVSLSVKWK